MSVIFTIDELRGVVLPKWKDILRLQDWHTDIAIMRARDMFTAEVAGCVNFSVDKKHAIIQILDAVDWDPDPKPKPDQDMEHTVVHELLHLHTAEWMQNTKPFEEQAINAIADALIRLNRQTEPE